MGSLIYGFVVVAWLVINLDDQSQHIPFATIKACQEAAELVGKPWISYRVFCLPTGVK